MTPSSTQRCREIEAVFHDLEDGEFAIVSAEQRSCVVGDPATARTVLYTTKIHGVERVLDLLDAPRPVLIVGRYGLPVSADLASLTGGMREVRRYFAGDADPPDILAFAWLREHVAIEWAGVCDRWLERGVAGSRRACEIAMSEAERRAMDRLPDLCPDFRDLLGPRCSATLERGCKIEREAVGSDEPR